jgi:hypothetical protein
MSRKIKSIPITAEDVIFIFNDNTDYLNFVTSNCYCRQCDNDYNSTMVNYTIALNSLNDIEFSGFCKECNTKLGRYIETGEVPETAEKASAIWDTNAALKELKIKKAK